MCSQRMGASPRYSSRPATPSDGERRSGRLPVTSLRGLASTWTVHRRGGALDGRDAPSGLTTPQPGCTEATSIRAGDGSRAPYTTEAGQTMADEGPTRPSQYRLMLEELGSAWGLVGDELLGDLDDRDLVELIDRLAVIVFDAVDELHRRHDPDYVPAPRPIPFQRRWPPETGGLDEPNGNGEDA